MQNLFPYILIAPLLTISCTPTCQPVQEEAAPMARLTWQEVLAQDSFFPLMPYEPMHGFRKRIEHPYGARSMVDCHFSLAGFGLREDLPEMERLGLRTILWPAGGFIDRKKWDSFTPAEAEAIMRQAIADGGDSPAILGYFISDEPGASAFPALAAAVRAVEQYAPGKLAYINLFPDYANPRKQLHTKDFREYVERFCEEVRPPILSWDNYAVLYGKDQKYRERNKSYYGNLLEMRRASVKYGIPFWQIVSSLQIRPSTTPPSPANLLLQAWTTLAAGGQGVTWYEYFHRGERYDYEPIDRHGKKTATWQYMQMVNRQLRAVGPWMKRLTSTGVHFAGTAPADGLPGLPGKLVTGATGGSLMIGEFTHIDGSPYLCVVNVDLTKSVKFTLRLADGRRASHVVSHEEGTLVPFHYTGGMWLSAGQGVLLRLK